MRQRVVITGMGVISSIGSGKDEFWKALIAGKSGISEISSFDTSEFSTHLAGEVKNFDPALYLPPEIMNNMARASHLAFGAASLAISDSQLQLDEHTREKMGVVLGTIMGESQIFQQVNETCVNHKNEFDGKVVRMIPTGNISENIAEGFSLYGPAQMILTACAAGNCAIGYAYDLIRKGDVSIMLAGGVDAFSQMAFSGFNSILPMAPDKVRPFDKNRKGMMIGEGSGVVTMESLEHALKRKAPIYAEISGYGLSCDAYHMAAPQVEGISQAILKALKESGIKPEDVDYYNAHGIGTPVNDKEECLAIKKVFGEHYKKLAVSSIKSMLGHTMGAASAIEAIACCLTLKHDMIPPTINYETPDPQCDIDGLSNTARKQKVNIAINHASAFGGNNASIVLKKFEL
ncbi:MAG: beta-ketoacyl-[acyl-carrier-protein] synthase family protein [Candidatus Omnitrophica bacterium]|nr:beta-ketoacyl-[acyl-carrier-protein] synthase family protein [Candidatus Omnitrophota bacterium]